MSVSIAFRKKCTSYLTWVLINTAIWGVFGFALYSIIFFIRINSIEVEAFIVNSCLTLILVIIIVSVTINLVHKFLLTHLSYRDEWLLVSSLGWIISIPVFALLWRPTAGLSGGIIFGIITGVPLILNYRNDEEENDSHTSESLPLAVITTSLLMLTGVFIGFHLVSGLIPCGWLDIPLKRSGCLYTLDEVGVLSVDMSLDKNLLILGQTHGVVDLRQIDNGQILLSLRAHNNDKTTLNTQRKHTNGVSTVALVPDGLTFASGSWNGC